MQPHKQGCAVFPNVLQSTGDLAAGFPGLAPQAVYLCLVCLVTRVLRGPGVDWKDIESAGPRERQPPPGPSAITGSFTPEPGKTKSFPRVGLFRLFTYLLMYLSCGRAGWVEAWSVRAPGEGPEAASPACSGLVPARGSSDFSGKCLGCGHGLSLLPLGP